MQFDLMDDSALAFARKVYTSLAAGKPLDAAIVDGRLEIINSCGRDERDFGVPVLYLGAHDGPLFPRRSLADGTDDAVSANPAAFNNWLTANWMNVGGNFGNHRKYESLRPNAKRPMQRAVADYLAWIGPGGHAAFFAGAIRISPAAT